MPDKMAEMNRGKLLSAEFLQSLELLAAEPSRSAAGGATRGVKRCATAAVPERAAYRLNDLQYPLPAPSSPEPLRQLLRSVFGRRGSESSLHLLVDSSQTMLYSGSEEEREAGAVTKFDYARKLAAAAGYFGLSRGCRVRVAGFGQYRGSRIPALSGTPDTPRLFDYLERLRAGGSKAYGPALRNSVTRATSPGVCVVLSDFFDPGWKSGVQALISRRLEVVLLQILTPAELAPDLFSDLRLVERSGGDSREIHSTKEARARHQSAIEAFCGRIHAQAATNGMHYLRVTTGTPVETLLRTALRPLSQPDGKGTYPSL